MKNLINIQVKNDNQLVTTTDMPNGGVTSVTTVTVVANGTRKPIQDYTLKANSLFFCIFIFLF